eukprot:1142195-Pelagomonas_calceolata.AAC.5
MQLQGGCLIRTACMHSWRAYTLLAWIGLKPGLCDAAAGWLPTSPGLHALLEGSYTAGLDSPETWVVD